MSGSFSKVMRSAMKIGFHALWCIPAIISCLFAHASPDISRYRVHSLPDSASLPPSWAGQFPVPDTEDGNSIFFWLFQAEDVKYDDNLIIWFNGGPGCSSLIGLTTGNGPVSFSGNSPRLVQNPHSWTKLGHVLYVDQPVGTGYSTASLPYPVLDNDRVTSDFARWLRSFFLAFPHLQSKRVYLIGESYAGIYTPYFASAIVESNQNDPSVLIDLRSISIGDGTIGNPAASSAATIGTFLQSHRALLQIPDEIVSVFMEADETCGFDRVLEQANRYPSPEAVYIPGDPEYLNYKRRNFPSHQPRDTINTMHGECGLQSATAESVAWSILNSTCYGPCATFSTALALMGIVADASADNQCFDVYNIRNDCDTINPLPLLRSYFSRQDVQVALNLLPLSSPGATTDNHTPTSFSPCNSTILETLLLAAPPVPPAYTILPSLVGTHNISLHVYSGEHDMLVNHIGTELVLQNMTWNGARGFSQRPSRVFFVHDAAPEGEALSSHPCGHLDGYDADAISAIAACALDPAVAGMWVSERGVTYHLFRGAGHCVFVNKPREMFSYVRDVVLAG